MLAFESADADNEEETVFAYALELPSDEEIRLPDSAEQLKFMSRKPSAKPECIESAVKAHVSAFESRESDPEEDSAF